MRGILLLSIFCSTLAHAQSVPFSSSNLPIIVIDTKGAVIVDEPKIVADMGIVDNGVGKRNQVSDPFNAFNGKIGIEIRGSSSQMFPKKQFAVELRDPTGINQVDASIFGMPKESDWILFAPYNDKTLIRDALAYRLGRNMGNYASRSRFFELVINGEYQGIYLFLEKIKRGKNRVNIDKLESTEISGDAVTGGYILKIDKTTGGDEGGVTSSYPPGGMPNTASQKIYFQYEYPKGKDIVGAQKTYIESFMRQFESTLASDSFNDPQTGWTTYADVSSFVDFFIMNELTKNPDAYRLSTFMYKKKDSDGGKLFMGPIWDFNLGFGNVNYCTQGTTTGLVIDFNSICPTDGWLIPFWWKKLWSDQAFRVKVSDRWQQLRLGSFSNNAIGSYIDSVSTVLKSEATARNFQKWPVLGTYVWPNYKFDLYTYDAEVGWLRDWVMARLSYLDATLAFSITGIKDANLRPGINVHAFPNPFDSELVLEYETHSGGEARFTVTDLWGREIWTTAVNHAESGVFQHRVEQTLSSGIYILEARFNGGVPVYKKLVKR